MSFKLNFERKNNPKSKIMDENKACCMHDLCHNHKKTALLLVCTLHFIRAFFLSFSFYFDMNWLKLQLKTANK